MEDMQPGRVISPDDPSVPEPSAATPTPVEQSTAAATPQPATPPAPVAPPQTSPQPSVEPAVSPDPLPQATSTPGSTGAATDTNWRFNAELDSPVSSAAEHLPLPEAIDWSAAEFVVHDKGAGWYVLVVFGGVILAALDYWLTKDAFSTAIIVIAAIAFTVYAARKPRMQQYSLTRQGIQVGRRFYGFGEYKSFSVAEEGDTASVTFMPLKRFMPPLTIYLTEIVENQVVDFLSMFMPVEPHKSDVVDSLLKRIRF